MHAFFVTMGFDWFLTIEVYVDPATGKPWVWSKDGELKKIPFNPEDWILPERFREFAIMRGHHLHPYIKRVEEYEFNSRASADILLHYFPVWEDIKDKLDWEDYEWDEAKHKLFEECLTWCVKVGHYGASWSY